MNSLGLLIITHGDYGKAALASAELIVGRQENCKTMGVFEVDNIDELHEEMRTLVKSTKTDMGLIILTDMLGGTPMNMALTMLEEDNILVCSGFNMPVLLEILMNRKLSIDEIKMKIKETYEYGLHVKMHEDLIEEDEDDLL